MNSRRQFLKKGLYLAPAILTLKVRPSFACPTYNPGGGGGGGPKLDPRRWRAKR